MGKLFGVVDKVVGYETDGCASTKIEKEGKQIVVPTCTDGAPTGFVIVAQAFDNDGGPGARWGAEWQADLPHMELYPGEFRALAVEAGIVQSQEEEHRGCPTLGYYRRRGMGEGAEQGGMVVNVGTTDWVYGLRRDGVVQQITKNVLEQLGRRGGRVET